ncbi:MAG: hypothetical protein CMK36_09105 [Porticoccaceae bacterium]|nr:hypothetical protein [Porticoccaceae bacterium]
MYWQQKALKEKLMIKFLDPRGTVSRQLEPYHNLLDICQKEGSGVTIGLLANGFPDSELFVRKVGSAIQKRLPKIKAKIWNKGNPGITVPEEMLQAIVTDCQVVVAAYGH